MAINRTTRSAGLFAGLGTAMWTLFEYVMGWHGPRSDIGAWTGFVGIVQRCRRRARPVMRCVPHRCGWSFTLRYTSLP